MRTLLIFAVAGWTLFAADGVREGRGGNAHYRAGDYPAAVQAYRAGLSERKQQGAPSALTAALWHNLGLALHRTGRPEEATSAFKEAFATAAGPQGRARAAYNAGTAAAQAGRHQIALAYLRQALLADPAHERARFNFEVVKRKLQRERQRQKKKKQPPNASPPPDIQPSPFAQRLKARADSLIAQHRYSTAYRLMTNGLRRDSTVRAFQSFIQRTGTVAQIDADSTSP